MKKKIRSVDERWHLRSANSASITSPSHWPWCGDVWVRACNVWLPQGPSYSMNVVVHIGKQRLCKPRDCHQILTSSRTVRRRQNDNLRFCLSIPCKKCERSTGAGARKLFERIVRLRRDMQRLIPYRTRGMVARPASDHSCRPTSLQWRTRRSAFKSSSPVDPPAAVSAARAVCNSAALDAEIGYRLAAHVLIDEHASRVRPSGPAQLLRFLKSSNCACVKISPSVWGILGDDWDLNHRKLLIAVIYISVLYLLTGIDRIHNCTKACHCPPALSFVGQ